MALYRFRGSTCVFTFHTFFNTNFVRSKRAIPVKVCTYLLNYSNWSGCLQKSRAITHDKFAFNGVCGIGRGDRGNAVYRFRERNPGATWVNEPAPKSHDLT